MALKSNIIANYIGRVYLMVIGIVMVPIYFSYIGAEAYGLVGFFALIQGWMMLLDLGLSPTIAREVSTIMASESNEKKIEFKYLFHSIEAIFIAISLTITLLIVFGSDFITNRWLKVESLNKESVAYVISLMGIMVGLRFWATLYRSGITASEEQVWYNKANIIINTLKFVGSFLVLKYISSDYVLFFEYQLLIAIIEFLVFSIKFYKIIGIGYFKLYFSFARVRPVLKFAISIAYTGAVWIFISQLDKLLLSNILSLKEYGYYTLVATIALAIIQVSEPIQFAILPRLTALYEQKKQEEMFSVYKRATQWIAIIIFSVGAIVSYYSYELLYSWTGDAEASLWGKGLLFWYAIANSILGLTTLQVYLQIAYGRLKLNVIYHTLALLFYTPLMFLVAYNYNVENVAQLWFGFVILTLLIWVPIVHAKFAPKVNKDWFFKIVAPIFVSSLAYVILLNKLNIQLSQNRAVLFAMLLLIGGVLLVINFTVSKLAYRDR